MTAYFSKSSGPFKASTRPYFLFLIEISKNSSEFSACIKSTVCWSSSKFCLSIGPFSRLSTNLIKYCTSWARIETPCALMYLTSLDKGRACSDQKESFG